MNFKTPLRTTLLLTVLLTSTASAATLYGYRLDVAPPHIYADGISIAGNPGIGRMILAGVPAVACMDDQASNPDLDYNDLCVLVPAADPLVTLGGLSYYWGLDVATREAGQVRFSGPEGSWHTGTPHAWVGYIETTHTPEPALLGAVGLLLIGVGWWVRQNRCVENS